jgi:antitoxin component YwqK of YwqJK toxin-antitoxin module
MKKALIKQTLQSGNFITKYHANGQTVWSKGQEVDGLCEGYWEWYRIDGTRKRSGYFSKGQPVGRWITYDQKGKPYKTTNKKETYEQKK